MKAKHAVPNLNPESFKCQPTYNKLFKSQTKSKDFLKD